MGNIYWNKDSNLEYANGLKKLSNTTTDNQGKMKNDFQGIVNNGLADQTVGDLNNSFDSLSGVLSDTGNVFDKFTNSIFDDEVKQASEISSMKIPSDFLADNATEVNYYNSVLLSKIDGKSVNEGNTTQKVNDVDDSDVVREALNDINNNVTQGQEYDKTSSIVGQSILENINGNTTEAKTYDDASQVSSNTIRNISGNTTQMQSLNSGSSIVGESLLGNISGNGEVKKQTFDDSAIAGAVLNQESEDDKEKEDNLINNDQESKSE